MGSPLAVDHRAATAGIRRFRDIDQAIDRWLGGPVTDATDWTKPYPCQEVALRLLRMTWDDGVCRHPDHERNLREDIAQYVFEHEARRWVLGEQADWNSPERPAIPPPLNDDWPWAYPWPTTQTTEPNVSEDRPDLPVAPAADAPTPAPTTAALHTEAEADALLNAFLDEVKAAASRLGIGDVVVGGALPIAPAEGEPAGDGQVVTYTDFTGEAWRVGHMIRSLALEWRENCVATAPATATEEAESAPVASEEWPNPFAPESPLHAIYARELAHAREEGEETAVGLAADLADALADVLLCRTVAQTCEAIRSALGLPPEHDADADEDADEDDEDEGRDPLYLLLFREREAHRLLLRTRHAGNWIVWSTDGLRILGAGDTARRAHELAQQSGEPRGSTEYLPPLALGASATA